jgi:hypothetical protein
MVCDRTWRLDELVFNDLVGYKVDDADSCQRLVLFCEAALEILFLSGYDTEYAA